MLLAWAVRAGKSRLNNVVADERGVDRVKRQHRNTGLGGKFRQVHYRTFLEQAASVDVPSPSEKRLRLIRPDPPQISSSLIQRISAHTGKYRCRLYVFNFNFVSENCETAATQFAWPHKPPQPSMII